MGKDLGIGLDSAGETGSSLIYLQGVTIAGSMDRDRWKDIVVVPKIF